MPNWTRIAAVDDCPPGEARELLVEDRVIALFQVDGRFYALDGICPHQGGPLGRGTLCGGIVTCPWHGWQFDVTTGRHQAKGALQQSSFPVKVEGQDIFVAVNG
jgi:nitrite reductase (NADH) small subunit